MYLCWGAQTDVEKHRQGGNIHLMFLNKELRKWAYQQKCKNKYRSGMKPPEEFFADVEKQIDDFVVNKTNEIWLQTMAISDNYDRLLSNWVDKKSSISGAIR
jgi:hypothetical protein